MVLRKYYYIDEEFVQDAYATIVGYDIENQEITESSGKSLDGSARANVKIVNAGIGAEKTSSETVKYNANITTPAKLQKILDYIAEENGDAIPYYELMDESIFDNLNRDEFFEGVFNIRFTKIETYSIIARMTQNIDQLLNLGMTDDVSEIDQIQTLAQQERAKGIACIMSFVFDKKERFFMYLNEDYLRTDISKIGSEVTVICKVSRIIPKGKSVSLTNLTELTKIKIPNMSTRSGRTQKVQQIKSGNTNSVKDCQDEIKGPAIEIVPIAIYK